MDDAMLRKGRTAQCARRRLERHQRSESPRVGHCGFCANQRFANRRVGRQIRYRFGLHPGGVKSFTRPDGFQPRIKLAGRDAGVCSQKWETSMNRIKLLVAAAFLAAITASAQDWAKARLENSPRHREWVKLKHGDREVNGYIAYPEVKDKATAVVVIHEIFGLTDWVRGVTDQLAEAGYIAIAPDLLSGAAPGGGGTAELGGNDAATKAIRTLPP